MELQISEWGEMIIEFALILTLLTFASVMTHRLRSGKNSITFSMVRAFIFLAGAITADFTLSGMLIFGYMKPEYTHILLLLQLFDSGCKLLLLITLWVTVGVIKIELMHTLGDIDLTTSTISSDNSD